jgi:hypothetical protein
VKTLASFGAGRALLSAVGVQPRQYQLLVDLFGTLGERKELLGNLGMDKHAMNLTSLGLLIPGGFLALLGFGGGSLAMFNLITLAVSSLVLFMLLVMEASNSFLNPAEAAVLAHRPIAGATYFAAKLTYLVIVVLRATVALNGPAALTGLVKPEARWFYPITHFVAACAAGLFLALVACAVFGLLFRILPASRVRSAAMWVQLVVSTLPLGFNVVRRPLGNLMAAVAPRATGVDWSFVPLTWFNAIALMGQGGGRISMGWPALVSMIVSAVFIGFGVRSLSAGYMTRIVGVMRSRGARWRRPMRRSPLGRIVRMLSGRPSGQAALGFMACMMRRDWQFRRGIIPLVLLPLMLGPLMFRAGAGVAPFGAGRFSIIGLLPVVLSFLTLAICQMLAFSDHYRGAWVFVITPASGLRGFVRGVYWSLWLTFLALPFVAVMTIVSAYWGLLDAALFTGYGLAVASLLLALQLLLVDTLPFTSAPSAERSAAIVSFIIFVPVAAGIAWVLQAQFIFRSRVTTAIAALAFAWAAKVTAEHTLRLLDIKARHALARQGGGPPGMFEAAASEG